MNILKNKKTMIVIIIFIVALVAYALMRGGSSTAANGVKKQAVSTNTVTTGGSSASQAAIDGPGKEFVAQLLAIQNINFALGIFEDPVFIGLQDWSREIQPQEAGRANPFAPFDDNSRAASPLTIEDAVGNAAVPPARTTTTPAKKR